MIAAGVLALNPVAGHAALGDETLKPKTTDSDVQDLQALLKDKGYFTYHKTTNYYGSYTTSAVKNFRKIKGLRLMASLETQCIKRWVCSANRQLWMRQKNIPAHLMNGVVKHRTDSIAAAI